MAIRRGLQLHARGMRLGARLRRDEVSKTTYDNERCDDGWRRRVSSKLEPASYVAVGPSFAFRQKSKKRNNQAIPRIQCAAPSINSRAARMRTKGDATNAAPTNNPTPNEALLVSGVLPPFRCFHHRSRPIVVIPAAIRPTPISSC